MGVDRLSVTVPSGVCAALRALADARGTTVSTIVAKAIGREIRLAALDRALSVSNRKFGPLDEALVLSAQEALSQKSRGTRVKRRKT
jgi:CopG-like RHH_1 or ribbon-helix-helix domain, RHH_5